MQLNKCAKCWRGCRKTLPKQTLACKGLACVFNINFSGNPSTPIWGCIKTNLAIFGGMNIHLAGIWGSLGYQGFDSYPYNTIDNHHFAILWWFSKNGSQVAPCMPFQWFRRAGGSSGEMVVVSGGFWCGFSSSLLSVTGIMVQKGNHPRMAELFSHFQVNY